MEAVVAETVSANRLLSNNNLLCIGLDAAPAILEVAATVAANSNRRR
jgi:hypothetical protein